MVSYRNENTTKHVQFGRYIVRVMSNEMNNAGLRLIKKKKLAKQIDKMVFIILINRWRAKHKYIFFPPQEFHPQHLYNYYLLE